MSGPKQHYIPQSLLKCFGKQKKGKAVQVTVYSRHRGVFTTSTEGVAAQRYFYSEPDDTGLATLDDRITVFETELSEMLRVLRDEVPGEPVNATNAAKAIAHLCVRQAHLRTSFASGTERLLDGMAELVTTREWQRRAMGLDDIQPNEIMRDTLRRLYDQYDQQLQEFGFTAGVFELWAFNRLKAEFDKNYATQLPFLKHFFTLLQSQTAKMARDGHITALENSLAPESRIEIYERLIWRLEPAPIGGFILPDCVALSWSARGGYQPLVYAGKDIDTIFMPLSHERALIGERAEAIGDRPELTNEVSAGCSWDCFVARDRMPELERLMPRIGERTRKLLEDVVQSALEQLQ
jgi:Protein of unknown function (DUF4238)